MAMLRPVIGSEELQIVDRVAWRGPIVGEVAAFEDDVPASLAIADPIQRMCGCVATTRRPVRSEGIRQRSDQRC